jgi:hypothetical protein
MSTKYTALADLLAPECEANCTDALLQTEPRTDPALHTRRWATTIPAEVNRDGHGARRGSIGSAWDWRPEDASIVFDRSDEDACLGAVRDAAALRLLRQRVLRTRRNVQERSVQLDELVASLGV